MKGSTKKINREEWMLALLLIRGSSGEAEPIVGRLKLMKQLFVIGQLLKPANFYEFVPYLYGPCSFDVYKDLQALLSINAIDVIDEFRDGYGTHKISEKGMHEFRPVFDSLDSATKSAIEKVKRDYNNLSTIELLAKIYKEYPDFAINSMFKIPQELKP